MPKFTLTKVHLRSPKVHLILRLPKRCLESTGVRLSTVYVQPDKLASVLFVALSALRADSAEDVRARRLARASPISSGPGSASPPICGVCALSRCLAITQAGEQADRQIDGTVFAKGPAPRRAPPADRLCREASRRCRRARATWPASASRLVLRAGPPTRGTRS